MVENICLMTFFDYIMHSTIKDVYVMYSVIMLVKTVHESYCIVLLIICLSLFSGTSRRTKLFGTFPGNYVKPL